MLSGNGTMVAVSLSTLDWECVKFALNRAASAESHVATVATEVGRARLRYIAGVIGDAMLQQGAADAAR